MSTGFVLAALGSGALVAALRTSDVLLGVVKTAFVVRGTRHFAALFAALEAAVWLSAAGIVFSDPTPARFLGFVVGVGAGTWIGMTIVHSFKLGTVTVRVFVPNDIGREFAGEFVADVIRSRGFGATTFVGSGASGNVAMVLSVVRRRDARAVCDVANGADPDAFVAVDNEPINGSLHGLGLLGARS